MIVSIWGGDKTAKTSFGLTFPEPITHFDFDMGFERAAWRFKDKQIVSKSFLSPVQLDPMRVSGMKELWQQFLREYLSAVEDTNTATIILDPANQLWGICWNSYLQELQENTKQGEKLRERLQPYEYREPGQRFRTLIHAARGTGKNLVLAHHMRDEYKDMLNSKGEVKEMKTGNKEMDGYNRTGEVVDLEVRSYLVSDKNGTRPEIEVLKDGLAMLMTGQRLIPTYDNIVNTIKKIRGEE